ncbi:MAG: ribulokinase, partial [Armatimonadetes bacterium]|nr:ribulokinase [Anaerolineae bacterium]
FMSKALQICDEDLALYQHADRLIEAGDWLVWQLTNQETRSAAMAGYKALYQDGKFPSTDFLAALNPHFKDVTTAKIGSQFLPIGAKAGELTSDMAKRLGLNPGVAVAVANIDAHASAPALQATEAGIMVLVMGTSTCHIISSEKQINVEGMFGVVQHGIIPNLYGYEAGQSGVGDIFAWFVENMVPKHYYDDAALAGQSIHEYLEAQAAKQAVGEHGLIALDWWNGNRSTLMNSNLSGIIIGLTLATRAPDIYRALIEATAFGTRRIIETYEAHGIEVRVLIAAGGLPQKNQLLRQIYADVTGRDIKIAGTTLSSAVGSAIFAALAAGIYDSVQQASDVMGHYSDVIVSPNPENQAAYQKLYEMYQRLYDYLGHDVPSIMADLKQNRNALLVNK